MAIDNPDTPLDNYSNENTNLKKWWDDCLEEQKETLLANYELFKAGKEYFDELNILYQYNSIDNKRFHLGDITDDILEELVSLSTLNLSYVKGNSFSLKFLIPFKNLKSLHLHVSDINLNELQYVPNLINLKLSSNVKGIEGLQYASTLEILDCRSCVSLNLELLKYLPNLKQLICNYNNLSDFSALKYTPLVNKIICRSNSLKSLSWLKHTPKLQELDCYSNEITSIKGLKYVPELTKLNIQLNKVKSLEDLQFGKPTTDCILLLECIAASFAF